MRGHTLASSGRSGGAVALPLATRGQSRSPAVADIIGARRARTAVMISSGSIPCRLIEVVPRLVCPSWLDDVQRHALAGELERVGMAQLRGREPASDARPGGEPAELGAHGGARPRSPAGRAVDDAEQQPDRQLCADGQPRPDLLPPPLTSMPTSRRRPPLPWRTRIDPRRWSSSCSPRARPCWTRSPARQRTTIIARSRRP